MSNLTMPALKVDGLSDLILKSNHSLIAGASGSGKSVLLNQILYNIMAYTPAEKQVICIDLKRVELSRYKKIPHCIYYADTLDKALIVFKGITQIIEDRYSKMESQNITRWKGSEIYIVIDELADLILQDKKNVTKHLQHISQISRAAGVHLICATQCVLAKVLPTEIKANFDTIIGLKVRCAQDSRNILGFNGAEALPRHGFCMLTSPEYLEGIKTAVKKIDTDLINDRILWWNEIIKQLKA